MAFLRVSVVKWNLEPDSAEGDAVAQKVREGLVPLLQSKPGFLSFQSIGASEQPGTTVSIAAWASAEEAEAGNQAFAAWADEHVGRHIASRELYNGEATISY